MVLLASGLRRLAPLGVCVTCGGLGEEAEDALHALEAVEDEAKVRRLLGARQHLLHVLSRVVHCHAGLTHLESLLVCLSLMVNGENQNNMKKKKANRKKTATCCSC